MAEITITQTDSPSRSKMAGPCWIAVDGTYASTKPRTVEADPGTIITVKGCLNVRRVTRSEEVRKEWQLRVTGNPEDAVELTVTPYGQTVTAILTGVSEDLAEPDVEAHAQESSTAAADEGPGDFGYARASADHAAINTQRPAANELSDWQREMLAGLNSGGSVKIAHQPGQENLAAELTAAMDDLVSLGLARRSNSGRYWAPESGRAGRPEVGEPVNVRLGDLLGRVDAWAEGQGMTRAAAIRELVSRGLDF